MGLDIGTGGVKAVLIDERGKLLSSVTIPLALQTPRPGWAEQHPEHWWKATLAAIKKAVKKSDLATAKIGGIGISGQMHSSVFLDRSLKVIRPALLWCDGRTTRECQEITAAVGEEGLRRLAGNPALEGFTLPKVLWLKTNEPQAFARLDKVVLAKDFIRHRLTGTLMCEPSDASGTLMFDTAQRTWSREIMGAVGLSMSLLPDIGGSAEVLGQVTPAAAKLTGLRAGTPVVGGGADNACGAVGVGIVS
ncbi:MAG: FGGY family carbohydrate kinase, partial [Vicinamibacteria bacterium]|nr:FGGY family carbohydrate kinase [Vicinamibacteria bacterium]